MNTSLFMNERLMDPCGCVPVFPPDVAGSTDENVWIGLSDRATEGEFAWSDGSSLDYEGWADEGREFNGGF